VRGLIVDDKKVRVANFHKDTVESFVELMAAAGLKSPEQINRTHVNRRINMAESKRYDEIFPYVQKGALLSLETCPERLKIPLMMANPDSFVPILDHA
jgi:hypothetical protein